MFPALAKKAGVRLTYQFLVGQGSFGKFAIADCFQDDSVHIHTYVTMGLAGVKKRSKLSHDPNNTTWSKSTTNFGHKILSKQGWKPGDFLGAENATHSEHFTAANASHIRVLLREDNLGLGAQIGKGSADTFGLSMFSGLLGRLNGKSEGDLKKQQDAIRDAELRAYTGQKYGFMNFVSGGLLVGDKIEPPKSTSDLAVEEGNELQSKRKRKAGELADDDREDLKSDKKRKKARPGSEAGHLPDHTAKEKRKKDRKDDTVSEQPSTAEGSATTESQPERESKEAKRRKKELRKAERHAKSVKVLSRAGDESQSREQKRIRKEARRKRKEEKRRQQASQDSTQSSEACDESEATAIPPAVQAYVGRQAVRQRYIQQKRMASMDPQALKEIFMLQAKATA